ncbi:glycosyltransferase family 4 protein [Ideonella azotifigens]|uniref:Glycosyltransferase subfamily 4-like N-terminal domain-containing protein n=3 Tax=Ideonella azotifigens TaxID=513160 RepID=A0ABN1JIM6_9BURK|nr:glycosyltransferase family 4 protein [Ideonella azotifigens]MCD2342049.1 glycosyltransferase family 4 protein [Ideonella azotifigens]
MTQVLMLTCQYMPDVFGGAEKQCQRVATGLAAHGQQVQVLTSTQQWAARGLSQEAAVAVHRLWVPAAPDLLGRWLLFSLWWWLAVMAWGWRHRRSIDVVHCHQGKFGAFVGTCLGRLLGKPVLIKIGNSEDEMDLRCLQRKALVGKPMTRFVLRQRPLFVAISAVIERNLREFGCQDVLRIPNGVPVSLAQPAPESGAAGALSDGPQFFYHGRIEEIKRVDVLIAAFAALVPELPPGSKLHIVGDGAGLPAARAAAAALGPLAARVVFHGALPQAVAFVQRFDVFVNASRAEGFSNSLLEALVLGKPMVSTPVSGAAEAIVDGVNGQLATAFDAAALAAAMRRALPLLDAEGLVRAQAASARLVDEVFAMPRVVQRYEALYPRLVEAAGSAGAAGAAGWS